MNKLSRSACCLVALLLVASSAFAQGLPTAAVMQFGNQGTGSPFPPTAGHDESIHAADKIVPRTVTIAVGGTVTFALNSPVHGVGVYAAGTQPSDIDTNNLQFFNCSNFNLPYINDGNNRLAAFSPRCVDADPAPSYQFREPGRYLVICSFLPHFTEADMYGWVIVGEGRSRR